MITISTLKNECLPYETITNSIFFTRSYLLHFYIQVMPKTHRLPNSGESMKSI